MRESARNTSCEAHRARRDSKVRNLLRSLLTLMTLVIVLEREAAATRSLKVRWGSLTMRQAVVVAAVRRGCGSALRGRC